MGINVEKIYMSPFAIGAALAAVAGGLYGTNIPHLIIKLVRWPTIIAFAIIIFGRILGSIKGASSRALLYGNYSSN